MPASNFLNAGIFSPGGAAASRMEKEFWIPKVGGHVTGTSSVLANSPKLEPKRSHEWLLDSSETEVSPCKKQAWDASSGFPSVPPLANEIMGRQFQSETAVPVTVVDRNMSMAAAHSGSIGNATCSVALQSSSSSSPTMSYCLEDIEAGLSCGKLKRVKVNQVKDGSNRLSTSMEHGMEISVEQTFTRVNESNFISMGQPSAKESGNIFLMNHHYDIREENIRSVTAKYNKNLGDNILVTQAYNKGDNHALSFSGYQDDSVLEALDRPITCYSLLFEQSSSAQTQESPIRMEVAVPSDGVCVNASLSTKPKDEYCGKNKLDTKPPRKEAPNSFPSNVRSLITTGILDGTPVRYVSVSREELHGVIKGSGYLCGCPDCNYSKALNAYEFELHAGSKTKHPNNHIYFENGKTIYQIVQELRSTPQSRLFDTIQNVTGSPINQKAFRTWKESFQAATREIQRIYGKDELNL